MSKENKIIEIQKQNKLLKIEKYKLQRKLKNITRKININREKINDLCDHVWETQFAQYERVVSCVKCKKIDWGSSRIR